MSKLGKELISALKETKKKGLTTLQKKSNSRTNLVKLHKKSDKDINYDDIPPTTKEFWKNAKVLKPSH